MSDNPPTPTQEFFTAWQLYQDVIRHNYMLHWELVAEIKQLSEKNGRDGMSILDLGCGDAYTIRTALGKKLRKVHYCGIDLSGTALAFAKEAFAETDWSVELIEADMTLALEGLDQSFDLIVAGHSLHHLDELAKRKALTQMRSLLTPAGNVLIYDLLPREGESRDEYVQRLLAYKEAHWTLLTAEQLASIRKHVENFDFPIEFSTWQKYAEAAGFGSCQLLFRDEKDHFGMLQLIPKWSD